MSSSNLVTVEHTPAPAAPQRRPEAASARPLAPGGDMLGLLTTLQQSAGNQAVNLLLRQYAAARIAAARLPTAATAQRHLALVQRQESSPADESSAPPAPVGAEGGPLHPEVAQRIAAQRGGGMPLDAGTRAQMEGVLGADLGDVRVHTGAEADALNQSVSATAFTTGRDVFFSQGAYQPGSGAGDQLLAHELTHVVQQRGMGGGEPVAVGPADDAHEQEASAVGATLFSGGVAGGGAGTPGNGVARRLQRAVAAPPNAAPGLHHALAQVEHAGQQARRHDPPQHLTQSAQAATPAAPNETLGQAQVQQAGTMTQAPAQRPETSSFLALLRSKLAELAPKTDQEMKEFKSSGKAGQLSSAVGGGVQQQQQQAAGPVASATSAPPPTGAVTPRPVGPAPAPPPPAAVAPVDAAQAVPPPAPDPAPALQQGAAEVDQKMADAKITPEQLQKANDPRFSAVNEARDEVHAHAEAAPAQFQAQQQQVLQATEADAHGAVTAAHAELAQAHATAHAGAHGEQQAVMSREAQERQKVADEIGRLFAETKSKVEATLNAIGPAVDKMFEEGEKAAHEQFQDQVDQRTTEHYILHPLDAAVGALTGFDPDLHHIFDEEREHYMSALDHVLVGIADRVEQGLREAKDLIAQGHAAIEAYVATLEPSLRASGQQAEQAIGSQFEALQHSVDAKKDELANHLVQRYQQAQQQIDKEVQALHDAHKGLLGGFLEKFAAVIKAIEAFKERLQGVVQDAGETLELVIKDPIAFLGHLLDALAQGFHGFVANIATHLEQGFIAWLTGSLGALSIQLPTEWDLKGVLSLVLQVLGVSWDKIVGKIRAKVTQLLGPRAMQVIDKIIDYAQAAWNGGITGLIEKAKEDLGNLKELVFGAIKSYLTETIVKVAIAKLVALSNPVGEIVEAVMDIYKVVMFFIEKANQILTLVETIVKSVSKIAHGDIGSAAAWVEQAMAATIPVVIGFLADLLGLGDLPDKVREFITAVQQMVDQAIDKALDWLIEQGKALFAALFGKKDDPDERTDEQKKADLDQCLADAKQLLDAADATATSVKGNLPDIKTKYKMTTLDLSVDPNDASDKQMVQIHGSIDPHQGEVSGSLTANVREKALQTITAQLGSEHSKQQVEGILAQVLAQLQPQGLKRLELGPKDQDGSYSVFAEASPYSELKKLAPKGRSVVLSATVQVTGDNPLEGSGVNLGKQMTFDQQGQVTDERRLPAPLSPADGKAAMGGHVLPPGAGTHEVQVVSWNTGELDPRVASNATHAERQFIDWWHGRPLPWRQRVERIDIHITDSPCTFCNADLQRLRESADWLTPETATIKYEKVYGTGALATTQQEVAGWTVTGPPITGDDGAVLVAK